MAWARSPPANIGGCANSKPFLQGEIGPPANSYGCCTAGRRSPGSLDQIGSLPGNKVSADCRYYIDNERHGHGADLGHGRRHGLERLVPHRRLRRLPDHRMPGGKDIEGVWRKTFFVGPTTDTPRLATWSLTLVVQLVH